jgi:hypothetical protein
MTDWLTTDWQLADSYLMTAWRLQDITDSMPLFFISFFLLVSALPDAWMTDWLTGWQLTGWQLTDNCLTTAWWLPEESKKLLTLLPGLLHILVTSFLGFLSLYLRDFPYNVFRFQSKTEWKINKLLCNIFKTSLLKTTKNQVTKMGWKQH